MFDFNRIHVDVTLVVY